VSLSGYADKCAIEFTSVAHCLWQD